MTVGPKAGRTAELRETRQGHSCTKRRGRQKGYVRSAQFPISVCEADYGDRYQGKGVGRVVVTVFKGERVEMVLIKEGRGSRVKVAN